MKRKLTQRGRERRQQILDVAARLFAERGYHPTSVAEIVDSLGVGKGVFYWYFESKEALFIEIMADGRRRLRRFQGAFIDTEPDPIRRIAKGIVASIDFIVHNRHVYAFLEHAAREPSLRSGREARRVHVLDVARHIEEAMASGSIPRPLSRTRRKTLSSSATYSISISASPLPAAARSAGGSMP